MSDEPVLLKDHPGFVECPCGGVIAIALGLAFSHDDLHGPVVLKCLACASAWPLEVLHRWFKVRP